MSEQPKPEVGPWMTRIPKDTPKHERPEYPELYNNEDVVDHDVTDSTPEYQEAWRKFKQNQDTTENLESVVRPETPTKDEFLSLLKDLEELMHFKATLAQKKHNKEYITAAELQQEKDIDSKVKEISFIFLENSEKIKNNPELSPLYVKYRQLKGFI